MKVRSSESGWAVVTGASSGLGGIFATQLAQRGMPLVLTGRDGPRLEAVRQRVRDITPDVDVELVLVDLGAREGVDQLVAHFAGRPIEILVNNAGFGTYGPFAEADAARERNMIGVNVDALMALSRAVLPGMLERGRGGILNVASTISFQPGPYQSVYGATKAFVLSLSQALWAETRGTGVAVTALCPGPTATGFVDALGADVSHVQLYRHLAAPEPVVAAGLRAFDRGRAVVVPGLRNKATALSGRVSPGWVSALVAKRILRPAAPERVPAT
jgi:short-subunit dehydrogenase